MHNNPRTLDDLRQAALGRWESLAVELRPTEDRAGTGVIEPTYLTRAFTYLPGDRFTGVITMYADPVGAIPLLQFEFIGHTRWGAAHPVADGAFAIDYVLDEDFAVTPLSEPAAGMLNGALPAGMAPFAVGERTSILGREFPLFAIRDGQIVVDYDLLYLSHGLLFFGAKHVDGTPFDSPEHRPVLLQVPLARAE